MRKVFKISVLSFVVGCNLAAVHGLAHAQSEQDIETIVTTANRSQTQHLTLIGNTSNISQQNLSQTNAEHLNQVLSQASGTWLSRGNGQESLLAVRSPVLTGAGSCAEFLTLENGISLRAPGFCNVNQLFDTHFELANRIEVVKGANSARYGSNAIHGTVNVFSLTTQTAPTLSLELGEDSFYRVNGVYSGQSPSLDYSLGVTLASDGGFAQSAGYDQQKISFAAEQQLGDWQTTHTLTATHLAQDTAGYLQRGEDAYLNKDLLRINDFADAYRNSQSFRYAMFNQLQEGQTVWQVTPYVRHTKMDFLMHFLPGTPVEENGHQSLGLQLSRTSPINQLLTLKVGADFDATSGYLTQTQAGAVQSDSKFLKAVLPQGKQYDYDVDARSMALYGQLDAHINDQHAAFVAARYDNTEYDYQNKLSSGNLKDDGSACGFGGCRYTRPADQSNRFDDVSYTVGYRYAFDDDLQLFAKHDNSFRAPHTSELYRLQNGQLISDVNSVNATQNELGMRYQGRHTFAELSLYDLKKTKGIYQDSDRQYLNGLDTEHRGVELTIKRQVRRTISTQLAASYGKHTYLNNPTNGLEIQGKRVDTAPELLINLQIHWQINSRMRAILERQQIGEYYLDAKNSQSYGGHKLYHLRGQWQVTPQLSTSLAILNLTDERYAERADFAFGKHRYFVGEPRNIMLKMKYNF